MISDSLYSEKCHPIELQQRGRKQKHQKQNQSIKAKTTIKTDTNQPATATTTTYTIAQNLSSHSRGNGDMGDERMKEGVEVKNRTNYRRHYDE